MSIGNTFQKMTVFVEIIPSEIRDIVSKPINRTAEASGLIDNACGYKSLSDAIVNAQNMGFRLISNVKPENMFFFFGETVESLQSSLRGFCNNHLIPYPKDNLYGPIYNEQYDGCNKNKPDPLAVVLCKIINANIFQNTVCGKQQKGGNQSKCYEIPWSELQDFQNKGGNFS